MTEYWLEPESGCLCATPLSKTDLSFFTIMTIDEFTKKEKESPNHKEILHNLGSIRYCKAERVSDGIIGTLRVPKKDAGHTSSSSGKRIRTTGRFPSYQNSGRFLPQPYETPPETVRNERLLWTDDRYRKFPSICGEQSADIRHIYLGELYTENGTSSKTRSPSP